jgi:hypothetical protein
LLRRFADQPLRTSLAGLSRTDHRAEAGLGAGTSLTSVGALVRAISTREAGGAEYGVAIGVRLIRVPSVLRLICVGDSEIDVFEHC